MRKILNSSGLFSRPISTSRCGQARVTETLSAAALATRKPPLIPTTKFPSSSHKGPDFDKLRERKSPLPVLDSTFIGVSGTKILHDSLIKNGVKQIFGLPGNFSCDKGHDPFEDVYNSLEIKAVVTKNEQGAGHMAEGYARVTGKPGVLVITSTSGVTNMVTPMQDALCDGTPMVVLCGQAPTVHLGADEFQETDVLGVSTSCTKWNTRVDSIEDLSQRINEAFEIATSGRPGPVLIEIPRHITSQTLTHVSVKNTGVLFSRRLNAATINASTGRRLDLDKTLNRVAHLVNISKRPVIYVGQGMLNQPEGAAILKIFADKASVPVTTSLQGLGAFDELDPKALHMLGLHGTGYANKAIQEADLIFAIGARFDDRVTGDIKKFAPEALKAEAENRGGIVHFEIAPKNINKVVQATEAVVGDCAKNLELLIPRIRIVAERPEWFALINDWKMRYPLTAYKRFSTPGIIKAQEVIEKLSDITNDKKDKTIITTGVGQHQMFAAQHFRWRYPRTMITSGGLGTMGYGLPAAIGAKIARPDCLVIDIDGDASFNMTMVELSTAARYNIGIKVLLCNNEEMGMVVDLQRLYYEERFHQTRQKNPNFVLAARALGVAADRCVLPSDMESKLEWLLEHDGPALLEVVVEKNSPVWPVVPAGKALHEFITYPES